MSDQVVKEIFNKVNKTSGAATQQHAAVVETLLMKLKSVMTWKWLRPALRGGLFLTATNSHDSLTEDTVTHFNVDFVLGYPFVGCNFKVCFVPDRKLFVLRWMANHYMEFVDKEGFLKSQRLQNKVFVGLRALVEAQAIPGTKIKCVEEGDCALTVVLNSNRETIHLHITPQIGIGWNQCQKLHDLTKMPDTFQQFVQDRNQNNKPVLLICLGVTNRNQWLDGHRLLSISFPSLENEFIMNTGTLCDQVRLIQLVCDRCQWNKKFGLTSAHLQYLAIKYADQLHKKSIWEGYSTLLKYLYNELDNWTLDTLFSPVLLTDHTRPHNTLLFQDDIAVVMEFRPFRITNLV